MDFRVSVNPLSAKIYVCKITKTKTVSFKLYGIEHSKTEEQKV